MSDIDAVLDTNVLVYAHDRRDLRKQGIARSVLSAAARPHSGVALTSQVLGEFWRVAASGPAPLMSRADATARVRNLAALVAVLGIDVEVTLRAVRLAATQPISYWDAQLVATAAANGVPFLLTEDLAPGTEIAGVRIVDPFAPDFDVEAFAGP